MSALARELRLRLLQERAKRATAHAAKLGDYIQGKLDEGGEPTWFMVRELDRRHDAMVAALAEVAAAEAESAASALDPEEVTDGA